MLACVFGAVWLWALLVLVMMGLGAVAVGSISYSSAGGARERRGGLAVGIGYAGDDGAGGSGEWHHPVQLSGGCLFPPK